MVEFVKVTARTPYGDSQEYMFMGDLDTKEDRARLTEFMSKCCDDCADKFGTPESWDIETWRNQTSATYELMED